MNFSPVPRPVLLSAKRASELLNRKVKPMEWHVQGIIPNKHVTLLLGDGGTGKSLIALLLAKATVTNTDWLGLPTRAGPVYYLSCEDDEDELQRRLLTMGAKANELDDLLFNVRAGEGSFLVNQQPNGELSPTELFRKIEHDVKVSKAKLVIIDNLADVFPDEGYGRVWPRQFITMFRKLAQECDCAVLILAHPSKAGMASGRGDDGSTAWSNSARSRLYLFTDENDKTSAILKLMKSNHSQVGIELKLRFVNGCYERELEIPEEYLNAKADNKFMNLMRWHEERGIKLNPTSGPYYAPKVFAEHPESDGMTKERFRSAMNRLVYKGVIRSVPHGRSNKLVIGN